MKPVGGFLAFLALAFLAMSGAGAQDKKDDVKKDEAKKEEAKKDAPKDGDKKDPEKKDEKKDPEPKSKKEKAPKEPEEKVVYGQVLRAKLSRMDQNSSRDFGIDMPQIDPMKVAAMNQWKTQRMFQIMQGDPRNRFRDMAMFQQELARKQNNEIYTMKEVSFRAAEGCKVRSMMLPIEFDDKGFLKKWTAKEAAALKGNTKLPGYPADFDRLKAGQLLDIYLAKVAPQAKKAKNILDDDDGPARPEVVMIVILAEPQIQR